MPDTDPPAATDPAAPSIAETIAGQKAVDPKRKKPMVSTGVAVGIGSAAIVAALLYANRSKRGG